jgi:hypothetical protein
MAEKNPHAVAIGTLGAQKVQKDRTKEFNRELAKKMAAARWKDKPLSQKPSAVSWRKRREREKAEREAAAAKGETR